MFKFKNVFFFKRKPPVKLFIGVKQKAESMTRITSHLHSEDDVSGKIAAVTQRLHRLISANFIS